MSCISSGAKGCLCTPDNEQKGDKNHNGTIHFYHRSTPGRRAGKEMKFPPKEKRITLKGTLKTVPENVSGAL